MQDSSQFSRRALLRMGGFAALAAAALVPVAATGQAEKKEAKERILFASNRDNAEQYAIYAMNADGSEQSRLSKGEGILFDPAWSPDHSKILFSHVTNKETKSTSICVMKADGSDETVLVPAEDQTIFLAPSWSPDGKHIAYSAVHMKEASLNGEIMTMDADGKNRKKVTDGLVPVWAPDGKRLLFCPIPTVGVPDLKVIDIDGANVKAFPTKGFGAAWSPDGKRIAYAGDSEGHPAVFVMDADGSHPTQLTKGEDVLAVGPVWTKDGKHILYTRLPKSDADLPKTAVWIMDPDGGNAKAVTKEDSFLGTGTSMLFVMRSARKS